MRSANSCEAPAQLRPDSRGPLRRLARTLLPGPLRRGAFRVYQRSQHVSWTGLRLWAAHQYDGRKPFISSRRYRGFILYYSRGTFFIDKIRFGAVWEAETAKRIVAELAGRADPLVVDAGANLGLMTLNVLAEVPRARIHAFECGHHQRALLARTIAANRLADRVTLHQEALGAEVGERDFVVHEPAHSALDGFLDTRRAGAGRSITVPVQTLDHWWQALGRPQVHVLKIDTEGAELWILEGARDLIARCRPVIFLEIQRGNLAVYPHKAEDVLAWLAAHGYDLEAYDGRSVATEDLESILIYQENFIARPRSG